jgi:hypothetical protein
MKNITGKSRFLTIATVVMLQVTALFSAAACAFPSPLLWTMKSLERVSTVDANARWKGSFPVFSGSPAAATINDTLRASITGSAGKDRGGEGESVEAFAASFIRNYEELKKERPEAIPHEYDLKGAVLFNRSGLLTVSLSTYAFLGGAHGNSLTDFFVFDMTTGRRLRPKDIFLPGFETRLNRLVDSRFRRMKGLSKSDRLDGEGGNLFENVIRYNENIALTEKGVTFLYNQYEIAAYVYGPTEIRLTWKEIRSLMRPRFRLP